ncbi:hypothetical protein J3B02_002548 [Coemansia erecta]|nr:hypothetical protein J3B02_002548 [Coemansia erecta]
MRAYTKVDTDVEASQLNPTDFHKYLQTRNREPMEFMAEESEILVSESFGADASLSKDASSNNSGLHGSRGVNEEFAKQIHDLLSPTYGE